MPDPPNPDRAGFRACGGDGAEQSARIQAGPMLAHAEGEQLARSTAIDELIIPGYDNR
jgi:hypothetical protein